MRTTNGSDFMGPGDGVTGPISVNFTKFLEAKVPTFRKVFATHKYKQIITDITGNINI